MTDFLAILFFITGSFIVVAIFDAIFSGMLAIGWKKRFWKCWRWGLLAIVIPVGMLCYGTFLERNCFEVTEVELSFEDLPEAFDGYRIVQISDIHSPSFSGRSRRLGEAVETVNGIGADLICFTGDIITVAPDELSEELSAELSRLSARDGVISILGNHDYCTYMEGMGGVTPNEPELQRVIDKERAIGWDLLLNEHRIIRRGADSIAVVGVENVSTSRHFPSTGDLGKASEGTDGVFRVLLTHDPTHWDAEIVGKDYPLTLSGHTHAMQFSIFGWCPSKYIFKQYRGLYTTGGQHLYVNIGLGETFLPSRIGARPEITVITLRRK